MFNSIEPRIQFTIESEQNNRLPFLDMTVIRKSDQSLTTEWYAKPIASGRMLNYRSYHQPKYKLNVANNLIHRVKSLTHNKSNDETDRIVHEILRKNNYPKQLINRLLHLYQNKRNNLQSSSTNTELEDINLPTTATRQEPPSIEPP